MVHQHGIPEVAPVNVSIYLGGGDRLMAEHLLHGPQVSSALDQVGGERVAEGMRTDLFALFRQPLQSFYYLEYHHPGESLPTPVKEEYVLVSYDGHHHPPGHVIVYLPQGNRSHWHQPLLVALACDTDETFIAWCISVSRMFTSSETLSPQPYIVSMMALFLCPQVCSGQWNPPSCQSHPQTAPPAVSFPSWVIRAGQKDHRQ